MTFLKTFMYLNRKSDEWFLSYLTLNTKDNRSLIMDLEDIQML